MPVTLTTVDRREGDDESYVTVAYYQNEVDAYQDMLKAFADFVEYLGHKDVVHDYSITPTSIVLMTDTPEDDSECVEIFQGSIQTIDPMKRKMIIYVQEG